MKKVFFLFFMFYIGCFVYSTIQNNQINIVSIDPVVKNGPVLQEYVPGLLAYGWMNICQKAGKSLGHLKNNVILNKLFLGINSLLLVILDVRQAEGLQEAILKDKGKRDGYLIALAYAFVQLEEIVEKNDQGKTLAEDRQEKILSILKSENAKIFVANFLQKLKNFIDLELFGIVNSIDNVMLIKSKNNFKEKAFLGFFTIPTLTGVDGIPDHEATLLSAVVEGWNFFSNFMNEEDKHTYLRDQFRMLIDYLGMQVQNIIDQFFIADNESSQHQQSLITINIHLF